MSAKLPLVIPHPCGRNTTHLRLGSSDMGSEEVEKSFCAQFQMFDSGVNRSLVEERMWHFQVGLRMWPRSDVHVNACPVRCCDNISVHALRGMHCTLGDTLEMSPLSEMQL